MNSAIKRLCTVLVTPAIIFAVAFASMHAWAADGGPGGPGGSGRGGGVLFLNQGGVSVTIPLDGANKGKATDAKGPDKAVMDLSKNRSEIQNIINGILDLEKDRKFLVTKAQAKKLLPILKRVAATDMLGFKGPQNLLEAKEIDALLKTTEDCLFDLEDILTPKQLGAIDEKIGSNPQVNAGGTFMIQNKGGGGLLGGGIDLSKGLSTEEIEKIKKEAEATREKAIKQNKANLEKCIELLERKN